MVMLMRKGVLRCFGVSLAVLGLLVSMSAAQDEAAPTDRVDELLAMTPAEIQALDADEREALMQELEALIIEETQASVQLSAQLEAAREQVRMSDEQVKQLEQRIRELRRQMDTAVADNPRVAELNEAFGKKQHAAMALLKLKRFVIQDNEAGETK